MRHGRIDDNHAEVRKHLERCGCTVHSTSDAGEGFPDMVVFSPFLRRTLLLEVKDGNKPPSKRKLTPKQRVFHRKWPADCYVVTSPDDALKVVGAL